MPTPLTPLSLPPLSSPHFHFPPSPPSPPSLQAQAHTKLQEKTFSLRGKAFRTAKKTFRPVSHEGTLPNKTLHQFPVNFRKNPCKLNPRRKPCKINSKKKKRVQISTLLENVSPIFRQHKMLSLPRFGHFPAREMAAGKSPRGAFHKRPQSNLNDVETTSKRPPAVSSFWDRFRVVLRSFCVHFVVALGLFCRETCFERHSGWFIEVVFWKLCGILRASFLSEPLTWNLSGPLGSWGLPPHGFLSPRVFWGLFLDGHLSFPGRHQNPLTGALDYT